jgi:competence protein ComEA
MAKTIVLLMMSLYIGAIIAAASQTNQVPLPEGEGKEALEANCVKCHELAKVLRNRQTLIGWQQTVENMIGRGAEVSDDDASVIVDYLAKNFGQININTATQAEIQQFLGLSDSDSHAIVAYRAANGKFRNFDQLVKVPGLDAATLQTKHDLIAYAQ